MRDWLKLGGLLLLVLFGVAILYTPTIIGFAAKVAFASWIW